MNGNHFTEDDKNKAVAFLNFVYKKAKWEFTTEESFEFGKLVMAYNGILKKIDEHILEVKRVIAAPEPEKKKAK